MDATPTIGKRPAHHLTYKILIAMAMGLVVGLTIKFLPMPLEIKTFLIVNVLKIGGTIFINILKMIVVPVVFVSLVCGSSSLEIKKLGRVGGKTLFYYIFTTALAITIALSVSSFFGLGVGMQLTTEATFNAESAPTLRQILINLFPSNPIQALSEGNMLQIIVFSLFLGVTLSMAGSSGKRVSAFFVDLNAVIMKLISLVMILVPYGVFCLVTALFAELGLSVFSNLVGYFFVVLLALMIQLFVTYGLFLKLIARLNPVIFFKKMYSAMLFAFSVASSNASIPIVLDTVENKLGVKNSIASFVIPLGATINMDGTAIMQGVATVFIANAYGIDIGFAGYLMVIAMATLASIGTAGVPSVGLITLAMVLKQVGIPVEGIGLIIGVDRILDMVRTAVNVSGDAMVSCLVANSEMSLDQEIYQKKETN